MTTNIVENYSNSKTIEQFVKWIEGDGTIFDSMYSHESIMKIYYYWIGFSFTKESRPKLSIPSIDSKRYLLSG